MEKTIFTFIFLFFCIGIILGQQLQIAEDPYNYKIEGLVYVKEFNETRREKDTIQRIPKEPLKFRIVGKEVDKNDNSSFYIIKFLPIESKSDFIKQGDDRFILKGNKLYINSVDNKKYFWIRKDEFENYITDNFITKSYKTLIPKISYGANILLPFKLRTKIEGENIRITPDITLGGYIGFKWRLSSTIPFYVTTPVISLGLATLSINDNNNSSSTTQGDGTVLGITGSTGFVFQINDFEMGLMVGWDRASGELGKDWIYNGKAWYSFSIGYSFFGNNPDK
jgi:hypothetical protein